MQTFFDVKLKGTPAPDWMEHGIAAKDKGRDQVVPPAIAAGGGILPETLRVIPEYDHVCCWVELWPRVLDEAERAAGGRR